MIMDKKGTVLKTERAVPFFVPEKNKLTKNFEN